MDTNSALIATANDAKITATQVPDGYRLGFLPRHFGKLMLVVESAIYYQIGVLAPAYSGGFWHMVDLSNHGSFMHPAESELHISAPNGFEGTVSGEVAGIIATLYALSHLSFQYQDNEAIANGFHALRDFALEHSNVKDILDAID